MVDLRRWFWMIIQQNSDRDLIDGALWLVQRTEFEALAFDLYHGPLNGVMALTLPSIHATSLSIIDPSFLHLQRNATYVTGTTSHQGSRPP